MKRHKKIIRAMRQLRKLGYVARGNTTWEKIQKEIEEKKNKDPNSVRGYVFWDTEDTKNETLGLDFLLDFGTAKTGITNSQHNTENCIIALELIGVLDENEINYEWSGSQFDCVVVTAC